jgi:hypothetical protein
MARVYTEVERPAVPAKIEKQLAEIRCDLCGGPAPGDDFFRTRGESDSVTVERVKGSNWPDGGWKETVAYDICQNCFETVLEPFLKEKGAVPHSEESDW